MLQLNKVQARVNSVTMHAEKHGDENVPACSVRFVVGVPPDVLDALDTGLRKIMFRKPSKDEVSQEELPGVSSNEGATKVRYPKLGAFSWEEKFTGYSLVLASGLTSTDTEKKISDVDLSKIKIEPKEGGSVVLSFSTNFEVDAELAGAISVTLQEIVELSLIPPTVPK